MFVLRPLDLFNYRSVFERSHRRHQNRDRAEKNHWLPQLNLMLIKSDLVLCTNQAAILI